MIYLSNEIQIFNNPEFGEVRVLEIEGEPWLVGKDVAEKLGYADSFGALKKHVDDEDKQNCQNDSFDSPRGMTIINESGLYALVLGSKLPTAKKFKRWVTSEVLPSIRKTGKYEIPKVTPNPHYRSRMLKTAVKDCAETADIIAKYFGVKPGMARAAAMQMVGTAYGIDTEPLRELIPAEDKPSYLTPTAIGEKLGGVKAKDVNIMLMNLGLQEKTSKGWQLTIKGKEYGESVPYNRNGHSGYQIQWGPDVVGLLK